MQNFSLLKRVAGVQTGAAQTRLSARWKNGYAAEYVMAGGTTTSFCANRAYVRFSDHSRNTLDLSVIPPVKKLSHLPILVDPATAPGNGLRAANGASGTAAGADGLLIGSSDPDTHFRRRQSLDFADSSVC